MPDTARTSHQPGFYADYIRYGVGATSVGCHAQWVIGLTLDGACRTWYNGHEVWLQGGDLSILRAGTHCRWIVPEEAQVLGWLGVYAVFHPRPHWLPWLMLPELVDGATVLPLGGDSAIFARARRHLMTVMRLHRTNAPLHHAQAMLTIERLLLALQGYAPPRDNDRRVVQALELLKTRYAHAWTVEELAHECHASTSHLAYLFQHETGMAPMQYLEEARMQRAREMLALGYDSIATIAGAVGYRYPAYFARRFRRLTGQGPLQYRKGARMPAQGTAS